MTASLKSAGASMDKVKGFISKHTKSASTSGTSKDTNIDVKRRSTSPTVSIPPVLDQPFPSESDFYRYRCVLDLATSTRVI